MKGLLRDYFTSWKLVFGFWFEVSWFEVGMTPHQWHSNYIRNAYKWWAVIGLARKRLARVHSCNGPWTQIGCTQIMWVRVFVIPAGRKKPYTISETAITKTFLHLVLVCVCLFVCLLLQNPQILTSPPNLAENFYFNYAFFPPFFSFSFCCYKIRKSVLCLPPWARRRIPGPGSISTHPLIKLIGQSLSLRDLLFCFFGCYKTRKSLLRLWARSKTPGSTKLMISTRAA